MDLADSYLRVSEEGEALEKEEKRDKFAHGGRRTNNKSPRKETGAG
jgi:hypothetical protein